MEVFSARKFPVTLTKSFPGKYDSLVRIGDFVRKIAEDAGFERFAIYSIEMAVDEACSNIIEHAYGGEEKGNIQCTCSVNEENLTITLRDQGKTFDLTKVPSPNLSKNIEDREAHGLGLYFIRQWMDEVTFTSSEGENIFVMVKRK